MSPTIDLTPYMVLRHFEDIKFIFHMLLLIFKKENLLFPIMTHKLSSVAGCVPKNGSGE
jgi:hypothetical protein